VPEQHILAKVVAPKTNPRGRILKYDNEIVAQVNEIFQAKSL